MENIIHTTRQDKNQVVDILTRSFKNDPHIHWYIGMGVGRTRRLRTLMEFSFEKGLANQEVSLASDKNAVATWRSSDKSKMTLPLLLMYMRFIWVMGMAKVKAITKLEQEVASRYPKNQPFRYLWLLGVDPNHQGKGLSSQLLKPQLIAADEAQLPTYLETTNPKNLKIYAHRGFRVYDEMVLDAQAKTTIYFMRRVGQTPAHA